MSVQPIDLQNLFLRLDQVGREQAAQQEAALHQQQVTASEIEHKTLQQEHKINRSSEADEGPTSVKDDDGSHNRQDQSPPEEQQDDQEIIHDPELGKHIDISG